MNFAILSESKRRTFQSSLFSFLIVGFLTFIVVSFNNSSIDRSNVDPIKNQTPGKLIFPSQIIMLKGLVDQFPVDATTKKPSRITKIFLQTELRSLAESSASFGVIAYCLEKC